MVWASLTSKQIFGLCLIPAWCDSVWRPQFEAIIRAIPQNATESFVHALLTQLDRTTKFSSDFVSTVHLSSGSDSGAQRASVPALHQLRSQVLLELFGASVSPHVGARNVLPSSGRRNDHALSHLFLHKLLLVKTYPASTLRTLIDFIARLRPASPSKGKEKATEGDEMNEGAPDEQHKNQPSERQLLAETLVKVVGVWGDKSFIRHSPYEQHKYLFRTIIYGLEYLTKEDLTNTGTFLSVYQ
jgi:hypothetical protein